jgi:hypothetical protein
MTARPAGADALFELIDAVLLVEPSLPGFLLEE